MRNFFIRVVINAIAIAITAMVIPNIHVVNNDIGTLLIIGLVFGIVNSLLKPILMFLTCPAVISVEIAPRTSDVNKNKNALDRSIRIVSVPP